MAPFKSSLAKTGKKLLGLFNQSDLTLRGATQNTRYVEPPRDALSATGGTKSTVGSYTLHTFTSSGSLVVSSGNDDVDFLIVGGGGAGGGGCPGGSGGGGGGAVIYKTSFGRIEAGTYPVTVGAGGAETPGNGAPPARPGSDSAIAFPTTFTAAGGGGGVSQGGTPLTAGQGGSGGGGSTNPGTPQPGRDATGTPGHPGSADAVSPDSGWGNPGGNGRGSNNPYHGGGGGGAQSGRGGTHGEKGRVTVSLGHSRPWRLGNRRATNLHASKDQRAAAGLQAFQGSAPGLQGSAPSLQAFQGEAAGEWRANRWGYGV